jgi:transketolase
MDESTTESSLSLEAALRCKRIRQRIVTLSYQARSAHLGSSLSCVEILDAILSTSNIRKNTVRDSGRDRLIFSKGHAAMAFYSALEAWGLLDSSLLEDYLKDGRCCRHRR